jgi:hypothetical protein
MIAQVEGQAQENGINKLCLLQNEVTVPSNRPEIVQVDLGKNVVRGKQGTDPDGSGTLLTLRDSLEKFSKIIQRKRQDNLIVWVGKKLEHRHPDELTDDMRINSDNMSVHRGLKNQPPVIILNNLEISIKQSNQPSEHNACTVVKISPVVVLDNLVDNVQRSHHNVCTNNVSLGNDNSVHNFGSQGCQISFCPLSNSTLWTASMHDSVKITNKICQK